MAPEMLLGQQYDQRVDIWALGLILYQMVTGELAFESTHNSQLKDKVLEGIYKIPKRLGLSTHCYDFLQGCL